MVLLDLLLASRRRSEFWRIGTGADSGAATVTEGAEGDASRMEDGGRDTGGEGVMRCADASLAAASRTPWTLDAAKASIEPVRVRPVSAELFRVGSATLEFGRCVAILAEDGCAEIVKRRLRARASVSQNDTD